MNLLHNKTEKNLKNLYLKYKKKYLNLKHQLGGDHYLYIIEDKKKHHRDPENSIILDIDKKIKEEFLKFNGDRDLGEKVYTDTIVQFSSSKVKRQFANQVQNLRTKAFRRTNQQWNQER